MKVICFMENGYARAKAVPNDASEDLYEFGVDLGPPDLTGLNISEDKLRGLSVDLVQQNLYIAPHLMGKRKQLLELLDKHEINREMLRNILQIFQWDFYGE